MRPGTRHITLCIMHCALCIILTACQQIATPPAIFHQYQSVSIDGWKIADSARFDISEIDHDTTAKVVVGIRTTNEYRYKDLKLAVEVLEVDSGLERTVWSHRLTANLYTDGDRATGRGFPFNDNELQFPTPLTIKAHRQYIIRVTHNMGAQPLEGVTDIGIKLIK